ncbi:MAG: type I restriction enzyme HsdR N-terminal domain-containing protein [Chlamydiae bacterium]|nr:type I restriction enzyme HsdR N-terminal domain-containing protein [Chlamydiota bacterium]
MGSSNPNDQHIYDEVRKLWVKETREELVRQNLVHRMIHHLGYPLGLLGIEVLLASLCELSCRAKVPRRRVDVVCFHPKGMLTPLLVIECKESASLEKEAFMQVFGYNRLLKARYVAVAHPEGEVFGSPAKEGYTYLPYLPRYEDLILL